VQNAPTHLCPVPMLLHALPSLVKKPAGWPIPKACTLKSCQTDCNTGASIQDRRAALGAGRKYRSSLLAARKAREETKDALRAGSGPSHEKKRAALQRNLERENSFEAVARGWHGHRKVSWSGAHAVRLMERMEIRLFPALGSRPIQQITASEILAVIRKIESRDALELSHRVLRTAGEVFRFAIATGRAERDPTPDLKGALKTRTVVLKKRVAWAEGPELMSTIDLRG